MAYISTKYKNNEKAPLGEWVCTRLSEKGPFKETPTGVAGYPHYCGQCVSFLTRVIPTIPTSTSKWVKGALAKGNKDIKAGTAIATFTEEGKYHGHAAIYEAQNEIGLIVYDQWVTSPAKAIHKRTLRFGAKGNSNNGDNFYVVE